MEVGHSPQYIYYELLVQRAQFTFQDDRRDILVATVWMILHIAYRYMSVCLPFMFTVSLSMTCSQVGSLLQLIYKSLKLLCCPYSYIRFKLFLPFWNLSSSPAIPLLLS